MSVVGVKKQVGSGSILVKDAIPEFDKYYVVDIDLTHHYKLKADTKKGKLKMRCICETSKITEESNKGESLKGDKADKKDIHSISSKKVDKPADQPLVVLDPNCKSLSLKLEGFHAKDLPDTSFLEKEHLSLVAKLGKMNFKTKRLVVLSHKHSKRI